MSESFIPFFVMLHTVGAFIGAITATWSEFFYTKAAADGIIDHHERKYLRHLFHGLRFGMILVLVSGMALIVLEYLVPNAPEDVLAAPFWMLITLTIFVIVLASLLTKKETPWWFASAAILSGWWIMVLIDLGLLNAYSYIMLLGLYVLVTLVMGAVLRYLRILVHTKKST